MDSVLLDLLRKRRSIRKFRSRSVESEKVEALIEAAIRTPTSRGRNPWEFVVVDDGPTIEQICLAKEHGSAFLANAPLVIVIAADTNKSDVWIEDCSIAAFTIQLAAEELGLGSCWAQIRLRQHNKRDSAEGFLKRLLDLPESYAVECVIGLGYPDEEKRGHSFADLPFKQVHRNMFTK